MYAKRSATFGGVAILSNITHLQRDYDSRQTTPHTTIDATPPPSLFYSHHLIQQRGESSGRAARISTLGFVRLTIEMVLYA